MAELSDKIKDGIRSGNLSLSSSDLRPKDAAGNEAAEKSMADEPTTMPTPALEIVDSVVAKAAGNDAAKALESTGDTADMLRPDQTSLAVVTVSPMEKQTYIQAVIHGTAFKLPFSLLGGACSGIIRSRSNKETYAILTQLEREIREKKILSPSQYNTRLRIMVLAAQIEVFNGLSFPVLPEPYLATVNAKNEIMEPGWLDKAEYWAGQPDHILAMLYNELTTFERKYWVLIEGARDADFWKPEAST